MNKKKGRGGLLIFIIGTILILDFSLGQHSFGVSCIDFVGGILFCVIGTKLFIDNGI